MESEDSGQPLVIAEREHHDQALIHRAEDEASEQKSAPSTNGQASRTNGMDIDVEGQGRSVNGVVVTDPADLPEEKRKKKKKKSKKPASKRGLGKPTGMEQFFADAPMTAAEHAEERQLYDPEISFLDRLLTAIQRFERTRRLVSERRDVFYKWLHYGGIKVSPNIGVGGQDQADMDKDQVAAALSRVQIPNELRDALGSTEGAAAKYAIEFESCMQSFLSRSAPVLFAFDTLDDVKLVTTTLERFLDYLMQHQVCQEFDEDILKARGLCREAAEELWACAEAQRWLPGQFNMACSTICGSLGKNFDGTSVWGGETHDGSAVFVGLTHEEADTIVRYAVAGAADNDVYEAFSRLSMAEDDEDALEVLRVIEGEGFVITELHYPTTECKDFYKENCVTYRPLGKVVAKPWRDPEAPPEDLTAQEKEAATVESSSEEKYIFFVEEIVLQHLRTGQKVLATVRQLNCGIWFFDDFTKIYPSFDLFLLNELMEDYKEPRYLPNAYVPGESGWNVVKDGDQECTNALNTVDHQADCARGGVPTPIDEQAEGEQSDDVH